MADPIPDTLRLQQGDLKRAHREGAHATAFILPGVMLANNLRIGLDTRLAMKEEKQETVHYLTSHGQAKHQLSTLGRPS